MSIESQLAQFIQADLTADAGRRVQPDDDLLGDGILDSAGIAQLLGFIEESFGIAVADEDLTAENFETISAVADLIQSKRDDSPIDAV